MTDVMDMIRASVRKEDDKREQIRSDFPNCTSIIDQFRAVFGEGVKAKYFEEDGKTMGKPQPFDGTDVDKLIRLDEMDAKRRRVGR
jgi:hypothetical protein